MLIGTVCGLVLLAAFGWAMWVGCLDREGVLGALIGVVLGALVILIGLKAWEYSIEPQSGATDAQRQARSAYVLGNSGHGLLRRLDDVSFNSFIFGIVAATFSAIGSAGTRIRRGWQPPVIFLAMGAVAQAAYLAIVCFVDPGTFGSKAAGTAWWIQQMDGMLCLLTLTIVHACLAKFIWSLITTAGRRRAVKYGWMMMGALAVGAGGWWAVLPGLVTSPSATTHTYGLNGVSAADLIKFSLAIWWPLPLVLIVLLWATVTVLGTSERSRQQRRPRNPRPA